MLSVGLVTGADRQPLVLEYPVVTAVTTLHSFVFKSPSDAWIPMHNADVTVDKGVLRIAASGRDPYVRIKMPPIRGPVVVAWRMRGNVQGPAQWYWESGSAPNYAEARSALQEIKSDGEWHEYQASLSEQGTIVSIRFDPCQDAGVVEVADVRLVKIAVHPLQFTSIHSTGSRIECCVTNTSGGPLVCSMGGVQRTVRASGTAEFVVAAPALAPFETVKLEAKVVGLSPLVRTIVVHQEAKQTDWLTIQRGDVKVQVARDGSGARFFRREALAAFAAPLAESDGTPVSLTATRKGDMIELHGGPVDQLSIAIDGTLVRIECHAHSSVKCPIIRVPGTMEQALLAGVEYLERGDTSSSILDIEGPRHLRFEPPPTHLTMPLAAYVTDRASVAMLWDNMAAQPVFSSPNRYDGMDDQLMALKGTDSKIVLNIGEKYSAGGRIEDAIAWTVKTRGMPDLPHVPRSPEAQRVLCLTALTGAVAGSNGWKHVAGPGGDNWFADHASTLWRLTGKMPVVPSLVMGGSHVENSAAFLVSSNATQWLSMLKSRAQGTMAAQQVDGSFKYDGPLRRGHWEDTASGQCAVNAARLLDYAWYTGNADARSAGLKTLACMRRFRTPRGAQVWEIPLHTPDILASAWLVHAYVRGYELTGNPECLADARRWAISGLPFVYQWSCHPVMSYATIAVFGATQWQAPVWIGLPVQWCGLNYAYSLAMLAPYDKTIDWHKCSEGILACAEQMQYPEGSVAGCLPDSFDLENQQRRGPDINPCVLVALRLKLDGKLDTLALATNAAHRIVSPFPISIKGQEASISAQTGTTYEVVIDGKDIRRIMSCGTNSVAL